ncbi:hypothetical protein RUM44_003396 [Polyplax serrata]|uniref:Ig-like domain-containing protein n=1 Tax=Polyplax serrata TaxID=468196 RepID=A0ABR1AHP7_POLSC
MFESFSTRPKATAKKFYQLKFAGVPQVTIAGLVGQEIELPCMVDAAKCGELHSIKWYRESTRIFVFSESANIAKSEGDFTDRWVSRSFHRFGSALY